MRRRSRQHGVMDAAAIGSELRSRTMLLENGMTDRAITAAVGSGGLRRLDHGFYVTGAWWRAAHTEERHAARVIAAHERRRGGHAVNSFTSAAVLHGLPLFRVNPKRVHLSGAHTDGRALRSHPMVARHEISVDDADAVELGGIPCTSLARTVADMLRTASAETAIALADSAFRDVAWRPRSRTYDDEAAEAFRAEVASRLPRGARGVRAARERLDFADGRAERPGESVSRLYLRELGFAPPSLQVPVPGPAGQMFYVDLGLDDVDAWGEFDGKGKYLDPGLRDGDTLEQVLLDEKMREDWIRGTTNRRFARWGMKHVASPRTLGARLASFHIFAS